MRYPSVNLDTLHAVTGGRSSGNVVFDQETTLTGDIPPEDNDRWDDWDVYATRGEHRYPVAHVAVYPNGSAFVVAHYEHSTATARKAWNAIVQAYRADAHAAPWPVTSFLATGTGGLASVNFRDV
jgi:hypothetical protein